MTLPDARRTISGGPPPVGGGVLAKGSALDHARAKRPLMLPLPLGNRATLGARNALITVGLCVRQRGRAAALLAVVLRAFFATNSLETTAGARLERIRSANAHLEDSCSPTCIGYGLAHAFLRAAARGSDGSPLCVYESRVRTWRGCTSWIRVLSLMLTNHATCGCTELVWATRL